MWFILTTCHCFIQRPTARTGCTKVITNDIGHIVEQKHRSSTSPWGSFVGTWQEERKPLLLKTECELRKKKLKISTRVGPNEDPTSSTGSMLNITETETPAKTLNEAKNEVSGNNIPLLVESPDHKDEHQLKMEKPQEDVLQAKTKTELQKSTTPQGSRPESRMAHQNVQSPLGFRPPSTISET